MPTIVTHPGSSHKDDFLATCVLLATLDNALVCRREPTGADLVDPDTYVVDVGLEYAPERHNFDHHQDRSLPCAFHLVMQYLGHHEAAIQVFAWYPHMSMMDVRGPYRTAEHLGVDSSILFTTSSPIDGFILASFAGVDILYGGEPLYALMQALGRDLIGMIQRKMERLQRLQVEARVVPIKHFKAVVSEISESPKLAMELFLRQLDDERIAMSITPSNRSHGWELLRLGDNRLLDFRSIADRPEVHFVHSSGFLATTRERLPVDAVVNLASQAVSDVV